MIAICKQNGTIHFVQRGTTIQNKYIALWPTKKFIEERAGKLFGTIRGKHERNGDHSTFFSELLEVAERLRIIVSEQGGNAVEELSILNDRLKTLIQNHPYFSSADKISLAKFGNEISIVFQNEKYIDRNVLFTGDVRLRKRDWEFIEKNEDGKVPMYDHYSVIKIPHHGTKGYYHSFKKYINDQSVILIPNGENSRNWNIDKRYSDDANASNAQVVCSDNYNCDAIARGTSCVCGNGHDICGRSAWFEDI